MFNRLTQGRYDDGDRVIGATLTPMRLYGTRPSAFDANMAIEIVREVDVLGETVYVTRVGSLFVRPPAHFSDPFAPGAAARIPAADQVDKDAFQAHAAQLFNVFACDLAISAGEFSAPLGPADITHGLLSDHHAAVNEPRSLELDQTGPYDLLRLGEWPSLDWRPERVLDEAIPPVRGAKLAALSGTLPQLVLGSYESFRVHQHAEALLDAWIVTEQLLDHQWTTYLDKLGDADRARRLKGDSRTYSAAVRTEMLLTAGVMNRPLYDAVDRARGHRNQLAHRAKVTASAANEGVEAMALFLVEYFGAGVSYPAASNAIRW